MAKLSLDLSQFKSAGVYTIEVDQSERITVSTQSLRLVPGFSTKGPFNSPVFIRSTKDRQRFFGNIDKKLERKGSFFHRSIDTCLLQAPVFAINLLSVNDDPSDSAADKVQCVAFSIDSSVANKTIVDDLYVNFFNRQRFWAPDTEYLQGVIENKYSAANAQSAPIFQLVNIGTKNLSFIVRKAVGIQGYDIYAKDWYSSEANIPYEWIRPYDKLSDYFVQIIAVEGDWSNYSTLSTDPTYSTYFSSAGLLPTQLTNFLNLPTVNLVGSWIGTIIPEFLDQTNTNQYIEDIVNGSTSLSGVMLNINKDALDQLVWDASSSQWEHGDGTSTSAASYIVDLVGHNLIDYSDVSTNNISKTFLSYSFDVSSYIMHDTVSITQSDTTGKLFTIDASSDQQKITVGTLIKKDAGSTIPGVTYVTAKIYDGSTYQYTTAEPIDGYELNATTVIAQKTIDDASIASSYKFIKLNGLNINNNHMPGYTTTGSPNAEEGLNKIYGMLEDDGILRGLTNPDMIQYRYIVDTMAYGLQANLGGKVYLSRLAKKRGKTTAILSAPSMRQLSTSQDPYFSDIYIPGVDPKPIFNTQWIAQGGNPNMPRTFRFTLPDEDNGSKYAGVFGPFLGYLENGKVIYVPPAADVSNTYVRKFLGGDPYAIVANRNGVISNPALAGLEYQIDQTDRDYLEPFGYNSIIERPATGEIIIYANVTSYQNVKSDYNYLHAHELLNTIELRIEQILKQYVFDYNNPITRLNIINSVTPELQVIKDAGALYDYEVIMDESNNTSDIINEGFAIIDVGVWINKGMEKIINRITVNKLGGASSGGFTTA